jgi:hypothetical protein
VPSKSRSPEPAVPGRPLGLSISQDFLWLLSLVTKKVTPGGAQNKQCLWPRSPKTGKVPVRRSRADSQSPASPDPAGAPGSKSGKSSSLSDFSPPRINYFIIPLIDDISYRSLVASVPVCTSVGPTAESATTDPERVGDEPTEPPDSHCDDGGFCV